MEYQIINNGIQIVNNKTKHILLNININNNIYIIYYY